MYKKILLALLVALLILGNVYFYNKTEKIDYAIKIGTPSGSGSSVERTDFSKPLSDKDEANALIFSLMDGISIDKPKVCEKLPNSTIWFDDWNIGATYFIVNLWVDENDIIVETNVNSSAPTYKKIIGDRATSINNLINKYKIKYLN